MTSTSSPEVGYDSTFNISYDLDDEDASDRSTFIASSIIVSWSSSVNVESNFIPVDGGEDEGSIADTKVVLELDIEVSNFDTSCITGQVISDVVSSKMGHSSDSCIKAGPLASITIGSELGGLTGSSSSSGITV